MEKDFNVFISYSQKDKEKVSLLASYISRLGLNTWVDIKELVAGQIIIEEISKAIEQADIYIVCLSPNAINSKWVLHELNTALTLEATRQKPNVVPILLAHTDIPVVLSGRLYLDMTNSLENVKDKLVQTIQKYTSKEGISLSKEVIASTPTAILSGLSLELQKETLKSFGSNSMVEFDESDVKEEAVSILKKLRKKANGVLLNFISAVDMDFNSLVPKFPNGEYCESLSDIGGDFISTLKKRAIVEVKIFNPSEEKVHQLISSRLDQLGIGKVTYEYYVFPSIQDLPKRILEKLQNKYLILGWDKETGAEVELPDDLRLNIWADKEQIKVGLETKYSFQLEKRLKEFSVAELIEWLIT